MLLDGAGVYLRGLCFLMHKDLILLLVIVSMRRNLIKYCHNRAFICDNWFAFHEEISKLEDIFHINEYPKKYLTNMI